MSVQFVSDGKAVSPLEYEKVLAARMSPQEKAALREELKTQYSTDTTTITTMPPATTDHITPYTT